MTTFPRGRRPRLGFESFADLTDVPVASIKDTIVFAGDLTPEEQALVCARIESIDDADQAARANLRTLRNEVLSGPTLANVAALAVAEANYELGETP